MNIYNKKLSKWIRPWDGTPDNIYNRDDRFFAIVLEGALAWLTNNIVMYGKPIRHFVFSTGSSYMYIETDGYKYSTTEVTGEDKIYMERPRCVASIDNVSIETAELTQPGVRGVYERYDSTNHEIRGYNAEMRRLPVTINTNMQYVMSTFNESVVLLEEIIAKMCFQRYFSVVYLGQVIQCSIEFPQDFRIDVNKLDMSSADPNNKSINVSFKIETSYPVIDETTEVPNATLMKSMVSEIYVYHKDIKHSSDIEKLEVT